jgi:heme a synthase
MESDQLPDVTGRVCPQSVGKFTFVRRDVLDRSSAETRYLVARFCRGPTLQAVHRDLPSPVEPSDRVPFDQDPLTEAPPAVRRALELLSAHLVVAVVALIVIGGATRVMEAGLACPDWPLCYGSLLPGRQMNLQVFLEWFHRLDAFVVGVALLAQQLICLRWAPRLPRWMPWLAAVPLVLVAVQGALGALTVTQLLASFTVTAHLGTALLLLLVLCVFQQLLRRRGPDAVIPPLWWGLLGLVSGALLQAQCLVGASMASRWAADLCLQAGEGCRWLLAHRLGAYPAAGSVLLLAATAPLAGASVRRLLPFAMASVGLVLLQVALGILTLRFQLQAPAITIAHQLGAALLVGLSGAMAGRGLSPLFRIRHRSLEVIHG